MHTLPLTLSVLQQGWLQEIQVAAPFIAPYKAAKELNPTTAVQAVAVATTGNSTSTTTSSMTAVSARQALSDSLALLRPEPKNPGVRATVMVKDITPSADLALPADMSQMNLAQLHSYANQCQACDLHEQRVQAVVGAGQKHNPDWFVISTAPSSNEELEGLPMQGKSGELFAAQMHSVGINISQQLYMTQLLKCKSTSAVQSDYIQACQNILKQQIQLIQPKRLLLLGSKAAALFLGEQTPFEALRGQVRQWQDSNGQSVPVVVSYHPSSILLRPQLKAQSWADLLLMKSLML